LLGGLRLLLLRRRLRNKIRSCKLSLSFLFASLICDPSLSFLAISAPRMWASLKVSIEVSGPNRVVPGCLVPLVVGTFGEQDTLSSSLCKVPALLRRTLTLPDVGIERFWTPRLPRIPFGALETLVVLAIAHGLQKRCDLFPRPCFVATVAPQLTLINVALQWNRATFTLRLGTGLLEGTVVFLLQEFALALILDISEAGRHGDRNRKRPRGRLRSLSAIGRSERHLRPNESREFLPCDDASVARSEPVHGHQEA